MTLNAANRTWRFPSRMLEELLGLTALIWVGFAVVLTAIIAAVGYFGTLSESVWAPASGVAGPFSAFIGGYMMYTLMPAYVANGQTRRDFAIEAAIFIPIFSVAAAVLMTIGFATEWGIYSVMDWPQDINNEHLYSSASNLPLVFTEHLLQFLVWVSAGALIGGAFYRSTEIGVLSFILALIPLGVSGIAVKGEWGPAGSLYNWLTGGPPDLPLAVSVLIGLASAAGAGWMAWRTVRDVPIRGTTN